MTIYEIKRLTAENSPYYFDNKTMKFFGQTLKDFTVTKMSSGRYRIEAPMKNNGVFVGLSVRFFDPKTNKLELE